MGRLVRITQTTALALLLATPVLAGDSSSTASASSGDSTTSSVDSTKSASRSAGESRSGSAKSAAQPAGSPSTSNFLSKLQVHGFLTQAYATTQFVDRVGTTDPTIDEEAIGIPEGGTFDYRTMALQFRYEVSPKDVMVIQFSSRALGDSPATELEDDIELDWAFYERRLTDNTRIKIGRVQIPLGIFNEIRDVGTILPFYRPPYVFYREGTFTSETVDGVALSHTFWPTSDWSLDLDLWGGSWHQVELAPIEAVTTPQETDEEGYGFQLWLNTPVSGLRFGLGAHQRDTSKGHEGFNRVIGTETEFDDYYFSVDAVFDKWVFRAEYRENESDAAPFPAFFADDFVAITTQSYAQLGFHPNDKFRIYLQWETSDTESQASIFTRNFEVRFREDLGIALNYIFRPDLVLKVEHHIVDGEDFGFTFSPTFQLAPFLVPQDTGSYSIVSLSASF